VNEPRANLTDRGPKDRSDEDALSPSIRQLLLSFGEGDSERTWNPDAFPRRAVLGEAKKLVSSTYRRHP